MLGKTLGPYRVGAILGAGGMGTVYRARHEALGRDVALKCMHDALKLSRSDQSRFRREMRVAATLDHPHLVKVLDGGEIEGTPYIAMELVDGTSLQAYLEREQILAAPRILDIAHKISSGLVALHGAGIIHRDLKPANVLLEAGGGVKIADFGVVRVPEGTELTAPGMILGTLEYLAPELVNGAEASAQSDLWALGCIVFRMCTGQLPFGGSNPGDQLRRILSDPLPDLAALRPDLPEGIRSLCRALLERDMTRRPRDARTVERELQRLAAEPQPTAKIEHLQRTRADVLRRTRRTHAMVMNALGRWVLPRRAAVAGGLALLAWMLSGGRVGVQGVLRSTVASEKLEAPEPIQVGEIMHGRLDDYDRAGQCHYWRVELAPGAYKFVVDVTRTDGKDANVGARLEWFTPEGEKARGDPRVYDGPSLSINEMDWRTRRVFRFRVQSPMKRILRVAMHFTTADYWLGLFAAGDAVAVPYFHDAPAVAALALGQRCMRRLDGSRPTERDLFGSLELGVGEYRVTADFARADGKNGNVGGDVRVLDQDGGSHGSVLLRANDLDFKTRKIRSLSQKQPQHVIFRLRAAFAPENCSLEIQ
jgi:hypothetical protein